VTVADAPGAARAVALFRSVHGGDPDLVVRSPGRVNLIGDHTDYNQGFVLPMAIDRALWIAARRRDDDLLRVVAEGAAPAELDLTRLAHRPGEWAEYVAGVAWSLAEDGHVLGGWDGAVASDVPIGAGLSSSAALEVGVARVFAEFTGGAWDPVAMALAARRAENVWVGMACGIMDQLVVAAAVEGSALLIDCRSLERRPVSLPAAVTVLVIDSGTRRSLVNSAYNERRAACDRAAAALGVDALRDADLGDIAAAGDLDIVTRRRARHVVEENHRVIAFATALGAGDVIEAGRLMGESHASLRDDFEVSTPVLDRLVVAVGAVDGCYGARLTGAGFGGCVVALAASDRLREVTSAVLAAGASLDLGGVAVYPSQPAAGAGVVTAG